ncbi:MAG: hypothetical protein V3R75_03025 [Alphaproteobacteria bacterium]
MARHDQHPATGAADAGRVGLLSVGQTRQGLAAAVYPYVGPAPLDLLTP